MEFFPFSNLPNIPHITSLTGYIDRYLYCMVLIKIIFVVGIITSKKTLTGSYYLKLPKCDF